jgi:hypothetical protein
MTRQQAGDGEVKREPADGPVPPVPEWLTAIRDHPDRPPLAQRMVLESLALRLTWKTGTGYASVTQLAADAGDVGQRTVRRATSWARQHRLARVANRGHRLGDGSVKATEWVLLQPSLQVTGDLLTDGSTGHGRPVETASTGQSGASQPDSRTPPSFPKKHLSRRPRLNGPLEGVHDGQGDDDDSKTDKPDPRTILLGLGADDAEEAEAIIARLEEGGIRDPATFMLGIIAKGDGAAREWLDWIRR